MTSLCQDASRDHFHRLFPSTKRPHPLSSLTLSAQTDRQTERQIAMPRPLRRPQLDHTLDALTRSGAGLPPSKRPKFDARNPALAAPDVPDAAGPSHGPDSGAGSGDIFLEVDEGAIGKRRVRRNAVELEGYASDSSDEAGFDATRQKWARQDRPGNGTAKPKAKGTNDDDDDDDMFGGSDEDGDGSGAEDGTGKGGTRKNDRKKKEVTFLELDDIEGQEDEDEDDEAAATLTVAPSRYPDIFKDERRRDSDESSSSSGSDAESDAGHGGLEAGEGQLAEESLLDDPEAAASEGKKKKKPRPPKREAFNMKSEIEEGRFDAAGNFVRKAAEKDAVHDSWLAGISRRDMRRAREAMARRDADRRAQLRRDDAVLTCDVLAQLISCLDRGETVLEALGRLGARKAPAKNTNKNQWRLRKKAAAEAAAATAAAAAATAVGTVTATAAAAAAAAATATATAAATAATPASAPTTMDVDTKGKGRAMGTEDEDPAEARRKALVEKITGAADVLLTRGQPEVYDETRESLMRQYRLDTGEDWVDRGKPDATTDDGEGAGGGDADARQWEFRWTDGRDDGSSHGPHSNAEMRSWNEHGYFREGVEFRPIGARGGWTRVPSFD